MLLLNMAELPKSHPYLPNKYTQWYYNIINNAKTRTLDKSVYIERHHIIPESFFIKRNREGDVGFLMGNANDKNNIVSLLAREHFIVHKLLVKMTTGVAKKKMVHALWHMVNHQTDDRSFRITASLYQSVREVVREMMSSRIVSEVTREKLRVFNTGKKLTPEQLQGQKGKGIGRKDTEQTREIKRQIALNRPPMSDDTKDKIRQTLKSRTGCNAGRITITDGTKNRLIHSNVEIPDGWYPGTWKKGHTIGKIQITNGESNQLIPAETDIPAGWYRGRTLFKKLKPPE